MNNPVQYELYQHLINLPLGLKMSFSIELRVTQTNSILQLKWLRIMF